MTARDLRRDTLFDLAVFNPDGFTVEDVMRIEGWGLHMVNQAIRDLRLFLADSGDTINLVCDPQGQSERWLYRLVGTLSGASPWVSNRVRDGESRVRTIAAVMASVVNATNGRTVEGRKARAMARSLGRLVEDLDDIADAIP